MGRVTMSQASGQDNRRERLVVIGGSGLVGSLIVPTLCEDYDVRVLDPFAPKYEADVEWVEGSSTDYAALTKAFNGVDMFVYLAMGPKDPAVWEEPELAALQFDMAVKGTYLTMRAAEANGVRHGVHASSMSVFEDYPNEAGPIGNIRPDCTHFYGLAKRLGEEVIAAGVKRTGISVMALRLSLPMADDDWTAATDPIVVTVGTAGSDVASAFQAGLLRRGHGFEAVAISGDRHERYSDLGPAKELLGWEPLVIHPLS